MCCDKSRPYNCEFTSITEVGCDIISSNYCNNYEKNTFIVYFKMLLFIFKYQGLINI